MAQEKLDIDELQDAADLVEQFLTDIADHLEDDGELSTLEIIQACIASAPKAIRVMVSADKMVPEMKDLDKEEAAQMAAKGIAITKAAMRVFGLGKK